MHFGLWVETYRPGHSAVSISAQSSSPDSWFSSACKSAVCLWNDFQCVIFSQEVHTSGGVTSSFKLSTMDDKSVRIIPQEACMHEGRPSLPFLIVCLADLLANSSLLSKKVITWYCRQTAMICHHFYKWINEFWSDPWSEVSVLPMSLWNVKNFLQKRV